MGGSAARLPARSRILVVDDELSVREVLTEGLRSFGYDTCPAASADEAERLLRDEPVDLILSDIEMPGRSGLDLLRHVRERYPHVDVVMVTGIVDTETAIRSIREGAYDYVTKPFNLDDVRFAVERTLRHRRDIVEKEAYRRQLEREKRTLEEKVEERTRELREKKQEIERLYRELEASYESTLQALVTALDFRDNETQGHSLRVVEYAVEVARELGIGEPQLGWIRRGAILHDVGKIGVPDAVLRKPGPLSAEEWEQMKKHPEMGYRMLQHIPFLKPALEIVLCHQERWDGSGYPRGLRGERIPLGARIFAVVDTFDAMTSDRPYRPALSIAQAIEEVRRFAGSQFDPRVAEAFLAIAPQRWQQIRDRVHRQVRELEAHVRRDLWAARVDELPSRW